MKLRRAFVFGCVFGFFSTVSLSPMASAESRKSQELPYNQLEAIWESLDHAQQKVVDLVAADFFERELSAAQQNRIVVSQAEKYRSGSAEARDQMRRTRRSEWQSKSQAERRTALLSAGGPYSVLTEKQRAPFRLYALDKLALQPEMPLGASAQKSPV